MVEPGCERDKSDPNKAHCWCDTEMCNTDIMLNVANYSALKGSSTAKRTRDHKGGKESGASQLNIHVISKVLLGFLVITTRLLL